MRKAKYTIIPRCIAKRLLQFARPRSANSMFYGAMGSWDGLQDHFSQFKKPQDFTKNNPTTFVIPPSEQTFDRGEHPRFICEHKLYWGAFSDPQEADYVTAVLNSDTAAVRQTRF